MRGQVPWKGLLKEKVVLSAKVQERSFSMARASGTRDIIWDDVAGEPGRCYIMIVFPPPHS